MSNIQKILYVLSVTTFCVAVILVGCASKIKEDLSEIKKAVPEPENALLNSKPVLLVVSATSYNKSRVHKTEMELQIKENEALINKLKLQIKKPGIQFDDTRLQKIELLQLKNRELKAARPSCLSF